MSIDAKCESAIPTTLLLAALLVGACSGSDAGKDDVTVGPDHNSLNLDDSGSSGSSDGFNIGAKGCGTLTLGEACSGAIFEGEALPLDIQIIFDQSGSMATEVDASTHETRLDAVRAALASFLEDTDSAGIAIGLSYFGNQPIGATTCNPSDFSRAAVEFGLLPDHASSIESSIEAAAPTGETPTGAAIRGGCSLAAAHQRSHPDHRVINLVVTDGEPQAPVTSRSQDCNPTLQDASAAARECLQSSEAIPSYVLGVGPFLDNLEQIADAGGTEHAYLVSDDSRDSVLEALLEIRYDAQVPCEFSIARPDPGQTPVWSQSAVVYTTADCELVSVKRVETAADCDLGSGGWYFDDVDEPRRITLCTASCSAVSVPRTRLSYAIGCSTIEPVY